jgi:parallel beta-helix repeat protein
MKSKRLLTTLVLGMGLTMALLWLLSGPGTGLPAVRAADLHVCPSGCAYSSIQAAVDDASDGDVIKVATGIYTGVSARAGVTQVVYINKSVTIRGGYTITFTEPPNPEANPTTLDAQGQGRVLYITGDISPTIEGLRITNGNAVGLVGDPSGEDAGGSIYAITATINVNNSQIFSNIAVAGGGLYFLNSTDVTLTGNTITNNTGLNRAGGLYFRNSTGATLIANTISNNEANHLGGGTKHHGGAYFLSSDNATLINNTISNNSAADSCGGMTFRSGSDNAKLIGNHVISNSAGSPGFGSNAAGGGLCFDGSSGANLIGNTVISNSTFGNGGGLHLQRSDITLINNVVADNQIESSGNFTGSGSGLYIQDSSPQLLHTTIARNAGGDGSGVCVTDRFSPVSAVAMTNTVLVSHTVGITVTAADTATLNGVLWYSNTINYGGDGYITVTNEYTGDPAFADDGYHLTSSSAAIDRGVYSGVKTDIDTDPRPLDGDLDGVALSDIGADEFGFPIYLPIVFKNFQL